LPYIAQGVRPLRDKVGGLVDDSCSERSACSSRYKVGGKPKTQNNEPKTFSQGTRTTRILRNQDYQATHSLLTVHYLLPSPSSSSTTERKGAARG